MEIVGYEVVETRSPTSFTWVVHVSYDMAKMFYEKLVRENINDSI